MRPKPEAFQTLGIGLMRRSPQNRLETVADEIGKLRQ